MDIERAKAIGDTAQVIINTAKAEIEFTRQTGLVTSTGFFKEQLKNPGPEDQSGGYAHAMGNRNKLHLR
ncbi:hypothetical protein [Nitrosomonas sp.]|uniref:hypothetical protein n=1 Tax=Nitrosomonas sp. TaxID=42353 RepID=UPI0025E8F6A5|nr:hypothetical protein [Nitrosomonas sp.]